MTASAELFQLIRCTFRYSGPEQGERPALADVTLTIGPGEKVALLGPSGAGKSTLLDLLYQQQPQCSALQPQGGGLVDLLSAYQNIFIGGLDRVGTVAALWNLVRPLAGQRQAITDLAQRLGLQDKLWHSVDRLSGGQRQRVALGRALFRQQPVFLGDEPVSAVDPVQAAELLTYVLQQHETAVVCLHNRRLALDLFDRIVVLQGGRICCDAPAGDLSAEQLDHFYQQDTSPLNPVACGHQTDGWVIRTS